MLTEGLHAFNLHVEDGHELSCFRGMFSSVELSVRELQFRQCGKE